MLSHDYWLRTAWLTAIEAELRAGDVVLMAQAFSVLRRTHRNLRGGVLPS
jgi:hypothetical protein